MILQQKGHPFAQVIILGLFLISSLFCITTVSADGFRSISSVKLTPLTYDDPWWELEETFLATINPRVTLLGRINWIKYGNTGSMLRITGAPVIVLGSGIYGELGYTLGIDNMVDLSHQLSLDMNWETEDFLITGGVKAGLSPEGMYYRDSFITGSAGVQKFFKNRTNPRIKYFGTINGEKLWSHSFWADFMIPIGDNWGISPGGTIAYTQEVYGWQTSGSIICTVPISYSDRLSFRYVAEVLIKPYGWGVSNLVVVDWKF